MAVCGGLHIADDPVDRDVFELLLRAQIPYIAKDKAFDAVRTHGIGAMGTLSSLSYDHSGRNGAWQDIPVSDTAMPAAVIQAMKKYCPAACNAGAGVGGGIPMLSDICYVIYNIVCTANEDTGKSVLPSLALTHQAA